ncbi:MAG TPA: ABC transporter permease, partial [Atopostipes sp.]|nr:ABC transporter permease [Atopostipes sp.]
MIDYIVQQSDRLFTAFVQHLQIVGITLLFSIALASVLSFLIISSRRATNIVLQFFEIFYSIPSLALFALLVPVTGLGMNSAIIVLVLYNQYLLIRNIVTGIVGIDPAVIESALAMGMSRFELAYKIQIPLAAPMIIAGIRLAVISTTSIATIASTINAGGLGDIIFDGLR